MHAQKFIGAFKYLASLTVSCVYEPFAPLQCTRPGQVSSLKLILDKKVNETLLEKLANTCQGKGLERFELMTVFKCSAYIRSTALDNLLVGANSSTLNSIIIRNMRGYSPLTLVQKLAQSGFKQLRHLELDNLNLS